MNYKSQSGLPLQYEARNSEKGISLVELLVSLVVLVLASTTAMSIFNISTDLSKRSNKINSRQAAIETDLSAIQSTAELYTCDLPTGTSAASCSVSTSTTLPGKNDYITSNLASKSAIEPLRALCRTSGGTDTPLTTPLKAIIDQISRPSDFESLGITRQPALTSTEYGGNSLIVIWSAESRVLYQAILTPPVASWCP